MNRNKSNSKRWQRTSTMLTAVIALSVFIVGLGILPVNVGAQVATVQRYLPDYAETNETFEVRLTQDGFFLNSGVVWEVLPEGFEYVNGSYTGGGEVDWNLTTRTLKVQFRTEYTIEYSVTASSFEQTAEFSGIYHAFVEGCIIEEWGNVTGDTEVVVKKGDTKPPVISNVASSSITTNSATITWDTDEISDSSVKYGTAPGNYTMEEYNTADVTAHSIDIMGLAADTTYYYVVNSTDQSGNSNESIEYSFTTFAAPAVISANVVIKPETLNLKSKGKFTAFVTLPEGYNMADIDISTVICEGAPAVKGMVADDNKYIAKFNIQDLVGVEPGNAVTLMVTGKLFDGAPFEGSDTIRVIDKGK